MNYSVAMSAEVSAKLKAHLVRNDGQEDLCFAIWFPSQGRTRLSALICNVLLPTDGDRQVHRNASFNSVYFERALGKAIELGGGVAFLHSHPSYGWQDMSDDDIKAETRMAASVKGATGLPLVGITLAARDGVWSARFWEKTGPRKYARRWAQSVREVGERLTVHFADCVYPPPRHRKSQARTVSAWGKDVQSNFARLRIGVIGLGSVGSIVAEALARTGIKNIDLFDYQTIEEVNLDRTLHAKMKHAEERAPKVELSAAALRESATSEGFEVGAYQYSICEEEGFRRALDCDLLFSCVDRPWGRSVLNFTAYAHLLPVIDGGIRVSRNNSKNLKGADWKAHVIGPSNRCLLCLDQYDPGLVESDRRGDLEDQSYLDTLPDEHPAKSNENVFGFSLGLASLELMQFITFAGPKSVVPTGPQNYHLTTGQIDIGAFECDAGCIYPELTAKGDTKAAGIAVHTAAENARNKVAASESHGLCRSVINRFMKWLKG